MSISSEPNAANTRALIRNPGRTCRLFVALWVMALLCWTGAPAAIAAAQGWRIDDPGIRGVGSKIDAMARFPTNAGHFTHYSGRILIDFERPAKSFTSFTVDSGSVDVGSQSFTDFVKGPALLDAEKFPTLAFTSTQVEKLDARTARVTGNLTMLGVTKPITLTVNVDTDPSAKGSAKERVVACLRAGRAAVLRSRVRISACTLASRSSRTRSRSPSRRAR